jgi:hypothetical protein
MEEKGNMAVYGDSLFSSRHHDQLAIGRGVDATTEIISLFQSKDNIVAFLHVLRLA